VFASVQTFGAVSPTPEEAGVATSPANGFSSWVITWGASLEGPATVAIDDQPFDATGVWDDTECGNFSIDVPQQTYLGEDGVAHEFTLAASFLTYARRLEGSGYYTETWTTTAGDSGKFVAEQLELRGVRPVGEIDEIDE
jgi:hypothetical protein